MTKTASHITKEAMAVYRATARRQAQQEEEALSQRLELARETAQKAADLLREQFSAKNVTLFGSVARGQGFHQRSDIDLAVDGIAHQDFWRAWSALDRIGTDFEFDLVDVETASMDLIDQIRQEGIEL